jgi:quercetin dioxygenase-like cupin family protein
VGLRLTRRAGSDPDAVTAAFAAEGCTHPRTWSGAPGEAYGWHAHGYPKLLFCLSGSIMFQDREGMTYRLAPTDRLDVEAGTDHSAEAGPDGVECVECFI